MRTHRVSRQRRREWEERAKQIRLRGQVAGRSTDQIVDQILAELPRVLPLEAHRLAQGWTREQLSQALDAMRQQDGQGPACVSSPEICGWEHGRHLPNAERQDCLTRVYRTRPDRLGFGRDHSRSGQGAEAGGSARLPTADPKLPALSELPAAPALVDGAGGEAPTPAGMRIGAMPVRSSGLDRRSVIKLLGGAAISGLAPQIALEHLDRARYAPRRVDQKLLESLRGITAAYANQRLAMAPSFLLRPVLGHLRYLRALLHSVRADPSHRQLGVATGEAAILAGWLFMSNGNVDQATQQYASARELAVELGDVGLAAQAGVFESTLHSRLMHGRSLEDTRIALAMLGEISAISAGLPAPLRARAAAQEAEESALLGRAADCRRALDRARRAADEISDEERVGLFNDWVAGRLSIYEGTCQLLLGDARGAMAALREALNTLDPGQVTARLCARVDLGSAHLTRGELEEGTRLIGEAFADAQAAGRQAAARRARRARERIQARRDEPAIRALDERLVAV